MTSDRSILLTLSLTDHHAHDYFRFKANHTVRVICITVVMGCIFRYCQWIVLIKPRLQFWLSVSYFSSMRSYHHTLLTIRILRMFCLQTEKKHKTAIGIFCTFYKSIALFWWINLCLGICRAEKWNIANMAHKTVLTLQECSVAAQALSL